MTDQAHVLVVGAGPAGLTLAHELCRRGVRVRLVDAADGPATTSRALATHPRTLETYDQMGRLDDLLPRGQRVTHFTLHQNGRRLVRWDTDYSRLPTRFPFTLMVDQVITEEVLRTATAGFGVTPEWGVRLESLRHDDRAVTATLRHPDGGTEEAAADWLVGCDGGHSTVRKLLDLRLTGDSSQTWLIADALVEAGLPRNSIHLLRTSRGSVMMVPFPDRRKWRLLDTVDVGFTGEDDLEQVAARFAAKISEGVGRPATVRTPSWVSVFTIQQRMIERMRAGRCMVAGDAAHVHSPASGQGMNTGVQDAYNLAWKLAMVVHGQADAALLDSYTGERVPIGARLLASTRVATALIQLSNPVAVRVLPVALGIVRRIPPLKGRIQRKIMAGMSGLALDYPDGVVLPARGPAPKPGERLSRVDAARAADPAWQALLDELRDPQWTLLVFGGRDGAQELADTDKEWLSVRTVTRDPLPEGPHPGPLADPAGRLAADLNAGPGCWILVRPDGYVAARGTDFTARRVESAVDALLRRPARPT
ncbi:FAD-dependent oxidoreductase [Virgisporangium aurantiacum]|uniref:Oxygenase n=1 Tax=Virgisporangium aurantiacum TaxID=175570 RepID=A0A8J3ZAJ5_9ACTN|nr:FAD-dependent oxidoreductase [Virgisporangium aurantiacum]GIJ60406.1 oxygenase [Virgisporangium aurantiacum]